MEQRKFVLASKNQGKLREMREILGTLGCEVVSQADVGVDVDVEETGETFEENSALKASAVMRASGLPAIADDSGLVVDALGGAPGVYSARFGGLDSDEERTALLLEKLENVPEEARTARFVSVITCAMPDGTVLCARGECEGVITRAPRGENGFGYDPVFLYEPDGATFAQLPQERKNKISHRAAALARFAEKLKEYGNADK